MKEVIEFMKFWWMMELMAIAVVTLMIFGIVTNI